MPTAYRRPKALPQLNTAALPEWKLSLPTSIFAAKEIGLISFLMPRTVIFWKAGKKRL
jgi:hypothetical protein